MFEAYKVGITIALTNQVTQGLRLLQGDFGKTDAAANRLKNTLKEIQGVGFKGLKFLDAPYEAAKRYEQVFSQFKALNLGDAVNRDADKFARGANVMGNSAKDMMESLRDMHLVINNYKEAKMLAPFIAQMEFSNKAVGGESAKAFDRGQAQALAKVMEWRGGFQSPAEMMLQGNMMQKVMSGTSFQVLPRDYRNFLATGGTAAQQMNNEAFYYRSEPLIQMMGGGAVGTGLQTAYNRLVLGMAAGSPGGKAYLGLLDKLHLIKPGYIETNRLTGKITSIKPNFLKDNDLEESDPYAFLEGKLVPALKAAGYDERHIETAIAQIYGRTGGKVMNQYHQRYIHGKIDSAVNVDKNAMDVDQLVKLARSSPQGADIALSAAWENLANEAGHALLPIVIPALLKLADALRYFDALIQAHPLRFDYIVKGFTGLVGAMAFSGPLVYGLAAIGKALRLFGLLFFASGPVALTIAGIGVVIAASYEIYTHWGTIKPRLMVVWEGVKNWLSNILDWIGGVARNIGATVGSFGPGNLSGHTGGGRFGSWHAPAPATQTLIVNNHMDPEKNARSVFKIGANRMSGPSTSGAGFDPRQSYMPTGISGSW